MSDGTTSDPELKQSLAEQQIVPVTVCDQQPEQTVLKEVETRFGLPQAGDIFARRYKITGTLGAGGMSVVYAAFDLVLKTEVALKILLPRGSNADKAILRFQKEATTIAKLNHENIIKVMDLNVEGDFPYIAMELLQGTTLGDVLKSGKLNEARAIKLMIQACDALEHAHSRGVVHRDVKPSNFMLVGEGSEERLKLVDFGIAKLMAPDTASPALTQTGETVGSPIYI